MTYCQSILQRGCSNLQFHQCEFLFPGCGFFNQQRWPLLKGSFTFKVHRTLTLLYRCPKLLQCSLACCQLSVSFSSPSPVLRWESLPRLKASCFGCFWQNHSVPVMHSICFIPFVTLCVPEMGRDYAPERVWALEAHSPAALGLNPGSASYWLCVFIDIWVTNKGRALCQEPRLRRRVRHGVTVFRGLREQAAPCSLSFP